MPQLPCLNVGRTNKDIWMPLELCHIVKGQQGRMKLDPRQQDQMVKVATQSPQNRLQWIDRCINQNAKLDSDPSAKAWGLSINKQMATVGPKPCFCTEAEQKRCLTRLIVPECCSLPTACLEA